VINNVDVQIHLQEGEEVHDGRSLEVLPCTVAENLDSVESLQKALLYHVEPGANDKGPIILDIASTGDKMVHFGPHLAGLKVVEVLQHDNEVLVEGGLDLDLGEILDNNQNVARTMLDEGVLLLLKKVSLLVPASLVIKELEALSSLGCGEGRWGHLQFIELGTIAANGCILGAVNVELLENLVMEGGLAKRIDPSVSAVAEVHGVDAVVSHVGDSEISPAADGEHLVHKFIGEGNLVSQDPRPLDPGGALCGQQGIAGVSVRGVDCLL